jgi:hypothetical protein
MEKPMISKVVSLAAAAMFAAGLATAPAAAATPAAPLAKTVKTTPVTDKGNIIQVRHLWRGSRICRRWRIRGWRYGSRRARRLYRRHCRWRASWRQCRRWRYLGWRRGARWARRQYRRHCRHRRWR